MEETSCEPAFSKKIWSCLFSPLMQWKMFGPPSRWPWLHELEFHQVQLPSMERRKQRLRWVCRAEDAEIRSAFTHAVALPFWEINTGYHALSYPKKRSGVVRFMSLVENCNGSEIAGNIKVFKADGLLKVQHVFLSFFYSPPEYK